LRQGGVSFSVGEKESLKLSRGKIDSGGVQRGGIFAKKGKKRGSLIQLAKGGGGHGYVNKSTRRAKGKKKKGAGVGG